MFAPAPAAQAQGLPLCGGNQTDRPAPRTCTNTRTIDGTTITIVLEVTTAGVASATYTFDAPRPTDTPLRIRWHEGISSGPTAAEDDAVMPAGSVGPVTLVVTTPGCGGQIDVKAVFTANGDERGRAGAPFISITGCGTPTTTTTTPPSTEQIATTVVPTTQSTGSAVTNAVQPTAAAASRGVLPETGGDSTTVLVAGFLAVLAGGSIVLVTRRVARRPGSPG